MSKCKDCGEGYVEERTIRIIVASCHQCNGEMKVAYGNAGLSFDPPSFRPNEVEIAEKAGVILRESYSKTVGESYLACICPKCDSFSGGWYLKDYNFAANMGELSYTDHKTGVFSCSNCDF